MGKLTQDRPRGPGQGSVDLPAQPRDRQNDYGGFSGAWPGGAGGAGERFIDPPSQLPSSDGTLSDGAHQFRAALQCQAMVAESIANRLACQAARHRNSDSEKSYPEPSGSAFHRAFARSR
jgi:hypothetical protein